MYRNNSNKNRTAWARGFMAIFAIILAMGIGAMASPAAAAPFAYVTNQGGPLLFSFVSVIDTATNTVVATLTVGAHGFYPFGVAVTPDGKHAYVTTTNAVWVIDTATNTVAATVPVGSPFGVAVTPDGKHAYVTDSNTVGSNTVSVIDTATNTVVATLTVGANPFGVAVTPDGKHAYVTNSGSNTVSVIDTATNTVEAATLAVGTTPYGVAVTPDGKHAYVVNQGSANVSVIDTATNTVEAATLAVGTTPYGVAVTPDGKHAYVTNSGSNTVSVIDTATHTVAATLAVGTFPVGVAVTPDGKHAYVVNQGSANVSVIDTATNTVEAVTVGVGGLPVVVGIVPPPPGVPFLAFTAALTVDVGGPPPEDTFNLHSSFTLRSTAPGIDPLTEPVTLQVGTFATTIPPGSFSKQPNGSFTFAGVINGVSLNALIKPAGTLRYAFNAAARRASLTGTANPVYMTLIIGGDSGATSVTAAISP